MKLGWILMTPALVYIATGIIYAFTQKNPLLNSRFYFGSLWFRDLLERLFPGKIDPNKDWRAAVSVLLLLAIFMMAFIGLRLLLDMQEG